MKKKMAKWVTWYMVAVMFLIGITPRVDAAFSPSEGLSLLQSDRQSDIQKIQKVLEVKMVAERLKAFGFTQDEIQAKLNQLNDQQIHQMAQKLDELNVGGDGGEVVIAILLIAILVVLIIYLSGHRVVIK
jgi:TolA-binding protein